MQSRRKFLKYRVLDNKQLISPGWTISWGREKRAQAGVGAAHRILSIREQNWAKSWGQSSSLWSQKKKSHFQCCFSPCAGYGQPLFQEGTVKYSETCEWHSFETSEWPHLNIKVAINSRISAASLFKIINVMENSRENALESMVQLLDEQVAHGKW